VADILTERLTRGDRAVNGPVTPRQCVCMWVVTMQDYTVYTVHSTQYGESRVGSDVVPL